MVSGPSGAGKDTLLNRLKECGIAADFIVTATTRRRRDYEIDGVNYHFVTEDHFLKMIEDEELLEYARVYGNWYGVPKAQVRKAIESGRDAIIKVDIQGAATIKKNMPEACFIFVTPPTIEDLLERLEKRNTETLKDLQLRIHSAGNELDKLPMFDYVVVNRNEEADLAVDDMLAIIKTEKLRVQSRNCRC